MTRLMILTILTLVCSCNNNTPPEESITNFKAQQIEVPAMEAAAPNLFVSPAGKAYLSWVAYQNDTTDALYFSTLSENQEWSVPELIASGTDWFVNWADFPAMSTFGDAEDQLAAHWLQKRAEGTYDYDVRVAISNNAGFQWSPSFIPHTDGVAAEHGFVSMLPIAKNRVFATWLDGRNTKSAHDHDAASHHEHQGAMTLRTAEFSTAGELFEEAELDNRICDCCQTDAAMTTNGPIVVYRDRSETEVRDISIVRKVKGEWLVAQRVYADNWEIAGCPVNGPSVVADGDAVAVAWFSAPNGDGEVKVAFSQDAGAAFSPPVKVDNGNPIGRVDVVFSTEGEALVSWIEQKEDKGYIQLARVNPSGLVGSSWQAAPIDLSRQSGFPLMEKYKDGYLLTWTAVVDEQTHIKSMYFRI